MEGCAWFLLDFAPCTFPCADFTVHAFGVIGTNHEAVTSESCESPSSGTSSLTVALGILETASHRQQALDMW